MKVTREMVDEYLRTHAPHLATYENEMSGQKGVYRKDSGPAFSFIPYGKTWRAVLTWLQRED